MKEFALQYGIDYEKGLKNCAENETFFKKILSMFLEDTCFIRAKAAYEKKDYKAFFASMHELKGVSGNVALVRLYEASIPLVEVLRTQPIDESKLKPLFADVEAAYIAACEGAKRILEQN